MILPNINLVEEINVNLNTHHISIWSGFVGMRGNGLIEEEI
jgi:hypothetical protein